MSAKVSPESVNLREAKPNAARKCGTCSMFREASQSCTLVSGVIKAGEVCDRWAPKNP